ncbi:haloalkane dehalogenase [Nonomuraea sp. NPDC050556]|uniref:haloalkane dehalogenase n=1 Tax=Nonomuraea sp. NPDC050556 TaxID=3364369 RepID=UPI0037954B4B
MRILRTPDERFAHLPDFPYAPSYADVPDGEGGTLRMAYVEAGRPDGSPVVLLHGEPSWSFLYRTVIRELASAGLRVIAPDLVGFGRSDKPAEIADHTYARHVEWTRALLLDALALDRITVVGQDWGGLIGLRLVAEHPERFARVVAANTGLPTGDIPMPEVWHRFKDAMLSAPEVDIPRFVQAGCKTELPPEVRAAYDAPFPDESYKAGPRAMPSLVPHTPDDPSAPANRAAWQILTTLELPFLVAFSDGDPITGGMAPILMKTMAGAGGLAHPVISGAGHFLQEDAGTELARHIASFIRAS